MYEPELVKIAEDWCGSLEYDGDGNVYIRIDTCDNTSKDNFDDLLTFIGDVRTDALAIGYIVNEYWADHDTQIIELEKVEKPCDSTSN